MRQNQAEEIRTNEGKNLHLANQLIATDPDDGVTVNYARFAEVLVSFK